MLAQLGQVAPAFELGDRAAGGLRGNAEHGAQVLASEQGAFGAFLVSYQAQKQARHAFTRRPGRQLGQPCIGLAERSLPALEQLDMQLRDIVAEGLHRAGRQVADLGLLHDDGIVLVGLVHQRLQPGHVRGLDQSHDALGTVRQILHQFDQAAADGEHAVAQLAGMVKILARLQHILVDRIVNLFKIRFFQPGEKNRLAQRTSTAVGFA